MVNFFFILPNSTLRIFNFSIIRLKKNVLVVEKSTPIFATRNEIQQIKFRGKLPKRPSKGLQYRLRSPQIVLMVSRTKKTFLTIKNSKK